jgi:hypothetical protein
MAYRRRGYRVGGLPDHSSYSFEEPPHEFWSFAKYESFIFIAESWAAEREDFHGGPRGPLGVQV